VSGKFGMGEYARSLAIARAAQRRWRDASVHFVLSREAAYAADPPFPTTLLRSSPTFHSAAVVQLLEQWRPHVVVFDNAGRTEQLRAARRLGARVVYISARRRQRRKAFRWQWMRLIDEHWIAYPEFIAGSMGVSERFKLRVAGRPVIRYLDVIFSRGDAAQGAAILSRAGCSAGTYVLVVPGGGTGHPGVAQAAEEFMTAARTLAADGTPTVFVGPQAGNAVGVEHWHPLGPLPQGDLAQLMLSARLIVANGGSTLLQAIACGKACVGVPIANDQFERIRRCVHAGVAAGAPLDAARIAQAARHLLRDDEERTALAGRAQALHLADGVEVAVESLANLVAPAPGGPHYAEPAS
jgi:hypothetical protein